MSTNREQIVVGVIYNKRRNKVLVSRRPLTAHLGGLWEFPGGKMGEFEIALTALKRELYEELNMEVESARQFIQIDHDYHDKKVKLDVWVVDTWRGEIYGKEGQALEWTWINQLRKKQFPAADSDLINAITLSPLYLISPDLDVYNENFMNMTKNVIENGVRLFQFRSKKTSNDESHAISRKLLDICNENGCLFLYNGQPEEALELGAHGVHLNSRDLLKFSKRPMSDQYWVAASCHNEIEVKHAGNINLDFCVLSPVHETGSHGNTVTMGWDNFGVIAEQSTVPVYALGGMLPADLNMAFKHGAHGIAMISGVYNARNPVDAVKKCLNDN